MTERLSQRRRECHQASNYLDPFVPPTGGPSHTTELSFWLKKGRELCVNTTQKGSLVAQW